MKRILTFLQRKSILRGEVAKPVAIQNDTPGPGLRREIRAFDPVNETSEKRSERYFGKWKPNKGDPSKFAKKEERANGTESEHFPKFYGLTDFRIEARPEPKPATSVLEWAKIAFERAFGIKLE